jgi:hypothetical protein
MQPGAVLFFPLLDRENASAKTSELTQFLLDFLQPFKPLAVSDLSLGSIAALTPILVFQFLNLCDLVAERPRSFREALLGDPCSSGQRIGPMERRCQSRPGKLASDPVRV